MKRGLMLVLFAAVLIGSFACSGCRRKARASSAGNDTIGGITGGESSEYGLVSRPDGGMGELLAVKFESVLFDYDSSQVNETERAKVEKVADYVRANAGTRLVVEGNCDERGSSEYNMALGERRALAVRAYLVGLGVDGSAIQTKSNGEENPAAMGHDESAWSLNRRAEFMFFSK